MDSDAIAAHAFGVTGYPTIYAIDATGRVRARWIGYDPGIERSMAEIAARYGPTGKTASTR